MTDYAYGYCGMPCALCSRYRTDGKSRCPGCSHDGYYTESCKVHHCCRKKQLEQCGLCKEFICERLGKMGEFSDLHTDHAKEKNCRKIAEMGFEQWYQEYEKKADLLTIALERYNNGRMKRYLCELFIQQDLKTLEEIMRQAESLSGDAKEVGKAFQKLSSDCIEKLLLSSENDIFDKSKC